MDDNKVTLTINGKKITFNVTPESHERLIDEMQPNSKVTPMHNFLVRSVGKESKEDLTPLLKNPSTVIEIGTAVIEAISPKLKITLGE
jgi:hypothetical protein